MAVEIYGNQASAVITFGGGTAPAPGTTENWVAAGGATLPAAVAGASQFRVIDPAAPSEIILVTGVSGTAVAVTRGAEGTTPVAHAANFTVKQVVTAGSLAAIAGQVSSPQRPVVTGPAALRRWRAMLGDALFAQVPVVCVGDSITAGQGGDNVVATYSNVPDNSQGWVGQLRALFANGLGSAPGEGFIFTDDSRVTQGGGVFSANWACTPLRHGPRLLNGSGFTLSLTIPSGVTSLGIIQANQTQAFNAAGSNLADVSALYSQTGSATVTNTAITTLTNTGRAVQTSIACQPGDTITVSAPATAQSYIVGFNLKTANPGVLVHRVGQPGYVSGDLLGGQSTGTLLQSASGTNQVNAARACYDWAGTQGLVIVSFGTNDQQFQGGGGTANQNNVTLALYTAWMEQFIAQAISDGWCCLVLGEPRSPAPGAGATLDQYWAAMQAFTQVSDHVAFVDVGDLWGSNAAAAALGVASNISVHPTRRGHGDIARMLYQILAGRSGITEVVAA